MIGARATGLTRLFRPVLGGVGAILMLHRVGPPQNTSGLNDFLSVDPAFLDALLGRLKRAGWTFVSMDEAVEGLEGGSKKGRFLAVTLDDGYRDNLEAAAPVFAAHQVPYTVYVCPGLIEAQAFLWWEVVAAVIERHDQISFTLFDGDQTLDCDTPARKLIAYSQLTRYLSTEVDEDEQRRFVRQFGRAYGIDERAHCRDAVMNWSELRRLGADPLCTIGAHTINHHFLSRLPAERARFEIAQCAEVLAVELGERPVHFAYPYGGRDALGPREVEIVRGAGYRSAVTTRHGLLRPAHKDHLLELPRISVNGEYQSTHYVDTMLSGITVPVANRGRRFVTVD